MPNIFYGYHDYWWNNWDYWCDKKDVVFLPSVMEIRSSKLFSDEKKERKRAKVV